MKKTNKIYIAGHRGLVGSALVRNLKENGYNNLILKTRQELGLLNQEAVADFFEKEKPDYVFLAAAKVGGIKANSDYPAQFIYENLQIQNNIIHSAYKNHVEKLLFLGSSCIYPKFAKQPIKEEYLLTGELEASNEPYAIAKIAGMKMCEFYNRQYKTNFISVIPTNLYGPNDNYDLENSHVLPAMIRKIHEAKERGDKELELWGSGKPRREFLHVDDLADACVFLMKNYNKSEFVNIGTGLDITIKELAETIRDIVGFNGKIKWNTSMPDGTPRKLLDVSRINGLGWKYKIDLREGIEGVYEEFSE